jgi:predicted transcriptional regulator
MREPGMPRPSDAELSILHVRWERGPSTVREVHERIGTARGTGYTTVLKLMQIMAAKGLVERDESRRSHVYRALLGRSSTQRRLVVDLLDRAFGGSGRDLVMQALSTRRASPAELSAIRA